MFSQGLAAVRRYRRGVSWGIVAVFLLAQMAGAAVSISAADPTTPQTPVTRTEAKIGPTDAQKSIELAVSIAPNATQKEMDAAIQDLANPKSPNYHKWLTPKEFTAKYIDATGRKQVSDFLKAKGLSVKDSGIGSIVNATGTAAQVQTAFGVTLNDFKDANGKVFYAADKTPALPTALKPFINEVAGLDDADAARPHYMKPVGDTTVKPKTESGAKPEFATNICAGARTFWNANNVYVANELAHAYNMDALWNLGYKGQGQRIAIFELSDWLSSDSTTFASCVNSPATITRVNVDGGTAVNANGQVEVNLDIDIALGQMPLLSNMDVYVAPNSGTGLLDEYQAIANANNAPVISTSWGQCESLRSSGFLDSQNTIFFQNANQGQEVFAASGDDGSESCNRANSTTGVVADDPSVQPYVIGVGGTFIVIDYRFTNARRSEVVWNRPPTGGAGGGGVSTHFAQAGWVQGTGTSSSFRQAPDISADADPASGYLIYSAGLGAGSNYGEVGGTSAAAPLVASGYLLLNQGLAARGQGRLGNPGPTLYSIFVSRPQDFFDIVSGSNCYAGSTCGTPPNGTYTSAVGYDKASGIGVPNFGLILNALSVEPAGTNIGIYRPSSGQWILRNQVNSGPVTSGYFFGGAAGDIPLTCDWTGSGQKYPVIFRPSTGEWFLGSDNVAPFVGAYTVFGQAGDRPVCGDWTGKGFQSIGIFRNGTFYLSDSNVTPAVNHFEVFGAAGDSPIAGDWTHSGVDRIGIFRTSGFVLASNHATFPTTFTSFAYGASTDQPLVGDWDRNGQITVGTYRNGGIWSVSNTFPGPPGLPGFVYGGAAGDIGVIWS